jgi:hypothetical protein
VRDQSVDSVRPSPLGDAVALTSLVGDLASVFADSGGETQR